MNTTDTSRMVEKALDGKYGLWVDTDYGQFDLFGHDLEEVWDALLPGEGFVVLGIITKS